VRYQQFLMEKLSAVREKAARQWALARPVTAPGLTTLSGPANLNVGLGNINLAPPAADGRAGTSADPILQSLEQSLSHSNDEANLDGDASKSTLEASAGEEAANTVKSPHR
jgi:hypothetical protein